MARRNAATGRLVIPPHWPKWKKPCGVTRKGKTCQLWAVTGMPTCRFHGSGGERNRELGQLRYLAWIVCGGPQDMPVELACRLALAVFAEAVLNRGQGSPLEQMKAAMWITQMLEANNDQAPVGAAPEAEMRSAPSPTDAVG